MRVATTVVIGALVLFLAGFVRVEVSRSPDPELVLGAFYALAGLGLTAVVAAGVALGIGLSRD